MKFKDSDFLRHIPKVEKKILTLLFFPPSSSTPSGFYLIEPNEVGGNKITLVSEVEVDGRTAKAWYHSSSIRARLAYEGRKSDERVREALSAGAVWSSLPAEDLVEKVMEDESCHES